jgi:hypothetical protein
VKRRSAAANELGRASHHLPEIVDGGALAEVVSRQGADIHHLPVPIDKSMLAGGRAGAPRDLTRVIDVLGVTQTGAAECPQIRYLPML